MNKDIKMMKTLTTQILCKHTSEIWVYELAESDDKILRTGFLPAVSEKKISC